MAELIEALLPPVSGSGDDTTDNQDQQDDVNVDDVDEGADDSADEGSDDEQDEENQDDQQDDVDADADADADKGDDKEIKYNAKRLPPELAKLCEANKGDQKLVNLLKNMYFTNAKLQALGKPGDLIKMKEAVDAFGSIEDVLKAKEQFDLVGGEAGLQEKLNDLQVWENIDQKWLAGDPEFIEGLARVNPESFAKIMPTAISRFGNDHPELYGHLMSQVVINTLIANGSTNNLWRIKQALAVGNVEEAKLALGEVETALTDLNTRSKNAPQVKSSKNDPAQAAWEEEKKGYQTKEQQRFTQDVAKSNTEWIKPTIDKELDGLLKGKKVSDGYRSRITSAIADKVTEIVKANKQFMARREALIKQQDQDGLVRLWKQYSSPLWGKATREVAREFEIKVPAKRVNGQPDKNKGTQRGTQKAEKGFEITDKYPNHKDVDRNQTTQQMMDRDEYILKDGRKIKVRFN